MIPLLLDYLIREDFIKILPDSVLRDLRRQVAEIAAWQLSITHFLTSILNQCAAAAIPCAPLRGPALASMLDPGLSVRAMEDIDLLVRALSMGKLLPGDRVQVELTPYDLSRGRITYRYK